jgi:hypothetical protein
MNSCDLCRFAGDFDDMIELKDSFIRIQTGSVKFIDLIADVFQAKVSRSKEIV